MLAIWRYQRAQLLLPHHTREEPWHDRIHGSRLDRMQRHVLRHLVCPVFLDDRPLWPTRAHDLRLVSAILRLHNGGNIRCSSGKCTNAGEELYKYSVPDDNG